MKRITAVLSVLLAAAGSVAGQTLEPIRSVEIGGRAELCVNGEPFLPLMLWLQPSREFARQKQLGFNVMAGYARVLRKSGTSGLALLIYKTTITLDTPVQLTTKVVQYGWRRLQGRTLKAEKSLLAVKGMCRFLTHGLGAFWRA